MNPDKETEDALAALTRAAATARIRAIRFDSKLAIWKDGAVLLVDPKIGLEQASKDGNLKRDFEKTGGSHN